MFKVYMELKKFKSWELIYRNGGGNEVNHIILRCNTSSGCLIQFQLFLYYPSCPADNTDSAEVPLKIKRWGVVLCGGGWV